MKAPTPYYDEGGITLYLGDCLRLLPRLDLGINGMCITDPPYNARKNYGPATNDNRLWPDWVRWLNKRFGRWEESCPETLMFLSQTAYRHYVRHSRRDMYWSAIWHKPLSMAVCAAPFMPHWEHICYFGERKKGQVRHADGTFVKHSAPGWGSDVFTANIEIGKDRFGHPTPKPMKLMREIVGRVAGDVEFILDPFAGSGTTLRAAKDLGVRAIGIEIDERHCAQAVRRLQQGVLDFGSLRQSKGA